jgi:hypothetical protein
MKVLSKTLTLGKGYGVTTPSGGWHIWFKYNKDIKQTTDLIEGIDVRNDGGLVGYSGYAEYYKKGIFIKGKYTPIVKCTLNDLPEISLEDLEIAIKNIFPEQKIKIKDKYEFKPLTTGSRNIELTRFVGKLYTDGYTPEQVNNMAKALNKGSESPLTDFEVENLLRGKEKWFEVEKSLDNIDKIDLSEFKDDCEIVSSLSIGEKVKQRAKEMKFLPTGFKNFDNEMKGGFLDNDFVILTGETKAGKTEVAINMVRNMTEYNPLYLTLEDPIEDQQLRKLVLYGQQEDREYGIITARKKEFTIEWITLKVKESMDKRKTKIVFIDNLDWIEGSTDYKKSIKIMQGLKALTEVLNICIVLLAHITTNKDGTRYGVLRPDPQRLKMGSHISQVATKVITVWRMALVKDKNTVVPVGCTTLTLPLARFPGDGQPETYLKFHQGNFTEISYEQKEDLMEIAKNKKDSGKSKESDATFFFTAPKIPQIKDN